MRDLTPLLAVVFALAGAASAQAEVVWLCRPPADPGPCRESLATTVWTHDGGASLETPPLPAEPAVDCFYVYPTVSEQPGRNANKNRDEELEWVARYQAARFSQSCRVFAPIYRQETLASVGSGGSPEALQLAYGDVAEAFSEYLARDNGGRGFVLIGHSQGTRMLRQLLRKEIEPRAQVRRRLVSALLLGGNVTVRRGQRAGGDFQSIPACAREGETGCVVAFSSFNETPPAGARYGRVPEVDPTGFGFPTGPEYQVLCTNPASLDANRPVVLQTLWRSERFPGFLGLLFAQMWGGMPPTADTPWVRPVDHYIAACEERDGAHVLMLDEVGTARRLHPAPEPGWGLHVGDVNLALGDLVELVEEQAAAHTAGSPAPPPLLILRQDCRRGRLRVVLTGRDRSQVRRVVFRLGRRVVARDARAPFRAALRRARGKRLRAEVTLVDGRGTTVAERARRCAA